MVPKNCPIIGEDIVIIFFDTIGYHSNSMTLDYRHGERASENNDYINYVNITWSKIPNGSHQASQAIYKHG